MSDAPLGRYHFLSWARRGIGASIENPDAGLLGVSVSKIPISHCTVSIDGRGSTQSSSRSHGDTMLPRPQEHPAHGGLGGSRVLRSRPMSQMGQEWPNTNWSDRRVYRNG